ncbi:A/G-specific adenine glycosylase [Paenibacillus pinistramenti]|uniref:A/G-specific adenine glycosylase n=1 Tax=Paenibacillus pinistramenti TaxID=1768003 RepID=UPI001109BBE8|nr:A/G-specific adenine glycosylase [Paenibacillus pinistramenti]
MSETNIEQYFSHKLLDWYETAKRDLPWRRQRDPYYIWVSEIMLQQTRVDTVIPYFQRFIERFPTLTDLALAPEEEVLKCWEGLGYYSRARNLQAAARQVVELHGGRVPDDKASVSALKGVGPYTAGAILSIAFGQPEPAVDGNVMRVLSRYFLLEDDIAKPAARVKMEALAARLIPEGRASDFNQALMELGALVCTPKSPHCLTCPVMEHCQARIAGMEAQLPVKTKAKKPRPEFRLAALVEGTGAQAGRVLVRQRAASGLLARMWELPHVLAAEDQPGEGGGLPEGPAMDRLAAALAAEGLPARPLGLYMEAEHTFSHIHWNLRVFRFQQAEACDASLGLMAAEAGAAYEAGGGGRGDSSPAGGSAAPALTPPSPSRWITREDMEELAFPNVFLRILNHYFDEQEESGEEL